ncbi:MAG: hypothetical protein Tsb0014_19800 [Pleurocapsa sp.]
MVTKANLSLLWSLLTYGLTGTILSNAVVAQVTPDNTTQTNVDVDGDNFTIKQGDRAGDNLFHSFKDFSVPNGGSAVFDNPVEVQNIFSRVTGGKISNIDGLIKANGTANLFLINPNGITFGSGASLELGGSFYGSTANSILFPNGVEFSATDTQPKPTLSINAPIGLSFRDEPGDIINRSNIGLTKTATFENNDRSEEVTIVTPVGLEVNTGKNLALIGGNIFIDGGGLTAPGGRVELGGLFSAGEIAINDNGSLSFPDNAALSNVSLTKDAEVDVSAGGGGFIVVNANNLELSEGSELFAGIAENMGSANAQAGDIIINATESVKLIGNGIDIEGLDTVISNHVGISAIKRENPQENSNAQGNGGSIFISTDRLELSDRAVISAITFSQGNAGDVTINANEVFLNTLGEVASRGRAGASGNAGNVNFTVDSLIIDNGFIVSDVGNFDENDSENALGSSGDVNINARDAVSLNTSVDGGFSIILSQVQNNGEGNAGNVNINTGSFFLGKSSQILTTNNGVGNAGNININAKDKVNIAGENGLILSQLLDDVTGNGGDIVISAPKITIKNSLISSEAKTGSIGSAGSIFLNGDTIEIFEGANISALATNSFDGGNINVNANFLTFTNNGKFEVNSDSEANAGNINLNINKILSFDENNLISAQARGAGNGGNINIDTNFVIASPNQNNDIVANAQQGRGGNITIKAESIIGLEPRKSLPPNNTNDIDASSARGAQFDGVVEIITPDVDALESVTEVPKDIVEPQATVTQVCSASGKSNSVNSLTIQGRDRVPTQPIEPLTADALLIKEEDAAAQNIQPISTGIGEITPVQGVIVTEDGQVILTAYSTDKTNSRDAKGLTNCPQY